MHKPAHMHHGVFEQHEIHGRHQVIVRVLGLLQQFRQRAPTLVRHVLRLADSICEMAIDIRLVEHNRLVDVLERFLDDVRLHFRKAVDVLLVGELVAVDALAFVQPQANDIDGRSQAIVRAEQQTLRHEAKRKRKLKNYERTGRYRDPPGTHCSDRAN